jgi:hypothetical protein
MTFLDRFVPILCAMDAQNASIQASNADSSAGSAICFSGNDCKTEDLSSKVKEGCNQVPAAPDAAASPDSSTLATASIRSLKVCPTQLDVSGESTTSSATTTPDRAASAPNRAQHIHDQIASVAVAASSVKDFAKKKYCEFPGCTVQPTFNFPGERGGSHCGTHRLAGQIK